jgi:hypothetical protein
MSHRWPPHYQDKPIPKSARVLMGMLIVPPHLPPGVLAFMEQEYRGLLWPPASRDGFRRYAREFAWESDGRVLHYRIIDTPSLRQGSEGNGRAQPVAPEVPDGNAAH